MRTICLYFQVHQPFRFRTYRFFDIGNDHYYYDDYSNESILRKVADKSYLPANAVLFDLLMKYKGKFKVAFSISGIAIEQFKLYAPEVLDSFKELAATGGVEFLAETYSHSLTSLRNTDEFKQQVEEHRKLIKETFGQEPKVFRNTELVYSDDIGSQVYKMGFKGMITEGAKHVLGWKSPNYLYCNAIEPRLKVLLKNYKLSDDIAFRFSNQGWEGFPLTASKYLKWFKEADKKEETFNLFMDYETFGEHQWEESGIFEFLKAFPEEVIKDGEFSFSYPSEVVDSLQVVSAVHVPNPISWADEERDLSAWLGNEMQREAFHKLYDLRDRVYASNDRILLQDFRYLQVSDHFYYMSTKFFSDGDVHSYFNPYNTPYEAFMNYMNVLSDFKIRVDAVVASQDDGEISRLSKIIKEKDKKIGKIEKELETLKVTLKKASGVITESDTVTATKKSAPRKPASKTKKASATAKKTSSKSRAAKDSSKVIAAKTSKKTTTKTTKTTSKKTATNGTANAVARKTTKSRPNTDKK